MNNELFTTLNTLSLPIRGRSWPKSIALAAWLVLAIIGARLAFIINIKPELFHHQGSMAILASISLAYVGMLVVAYYMWAGHTTISEEGIQQDWILRRELVWSDLKYARFIPLFYSKRLLCFTKRGRPVVFQGASQELQVAFAQISLAKQR